MAAEKSPEVVNSKNHKLLLPVILLTSILFLAVAFLIIANAPHKQGKPSDVRVNKPQGAVARVGNEYIYQKDLDLELSSYPDVPGVNSKEVVMKKLVDDSVALQSGRRLGFVSLDRDNFNSNKKNYSDRMTAVQKSERELLKK